MGKLFANCHCQTKKEHLRELEEDHRVVFNRVCNGSDELALAISISNEASILREHYFEL